MSRVTWLFFLLTIGMVVVPAQQHQARGDTVNIGESKPCWDSVFTADRCCDMSKSGKGNWQCWDNEGYTYEKCCDEESVKVASDMRQRLLALQSDSRGDLIGCWGGGGELARFPFEGALQNALGQFTMNRFSLKKVFPDWETEPPQIHNTRLLWRRGHLERPGRCQAKNVTSNLSLWLYAQLQARDSVQARAAQGWIVNLGAGFADDPMHQILRKHNLSAILVDPLGLRNAPTAVSPKIRFLKAFAEPGNLCNLFARGGLKCAPPGTKATPIDFLKIDVDSFDCVLASAALKEARPKAVWIEVNLMVPPPIRFARLWHPDWFAAWNHGIRHGRILATFGCSISAAVELFHKEGYGLYGFDEQDAVFIRRDLGDLVGGVGIDEFACYGEVDSHMYASIEYVSAWIQESPHVALQHLWCNLTVHDTLLGIGRFPFSISL